MTTPSSPAAVQTVLIVEDELSNLTLLASILQTVGHHVLTAQNWQTAMSVLQERRVDLILLDIILPDTDGYEICERLTAEEPFNTIPIIFITSLDRDFDEAKGLLAGAVDYLKKPINPTILKARVATHLNIKRQRELLEEQNLQLALNTEAYKNEVARRVQVEEELLAAYNNLEAKVKERTDELKEANRAMAEQITKRKRSERSLQKNEAFLAKQNARLAEINVALEVLLDKRGKDQKAFEERILAQTKLLIYPYINKIRQFKLNDTQMNLVDILATNLNEIVSPFARNVFTMELQLTPVEIQVANLVKQGNSSKEIAELINITPGTVDLHRKNIRRKCGLSQKKVNLRTYLLSF